MTHVLLYMLRNNELSSVLIGACLQRHVVCVVGLPYRSPHAFACKLDGLQFFIKSVVNSLLLSNLKMSKKIFLHDNSGRVLDCEITRFHY